MDKEIIDKLIDFRSKRDWEKYHTPKNLAEAIIIEAAELLKCFIWGQKFDKAEVASEIADILIFLIYLCHDLKIDMNRAVFGKIILNNAKYPEGVRHEWK